MANFTAYMASTSQIKPFCFLIIILLACGKGYRGNSCAGKCPFPSYGVDCQMICNCIEEDCDPANGCNNPSTGVHIFLIALNLM